jgi:alpha-galactosidase
MRYAAEVPPQRSEEGVIGPIAFAEGPLSPGSQRLGPLELSVSLDAADDEATVGVLIRSLLNEPLHVEALVLGFRWIGPEPEGITFLRHGWQSWSFSGGQPLDEAGTPPFPSGPWLRGLHHGVGAPPADREGWHESDLVSVAEDARGAACLVGAIETGLGTGVVYLKRDEAGVRIEVELRFEVPLDAGASIAAERVHLALGTDAHDLLARYADLLGAANRARTSAPFQAGWCSWYHFFHDVTEEDLLRNLEALGSRRDAFPVDVVQLDDGYQRAIGDWLETNEKFPHGLAHLAQAIRAAGFRPGLWTAPFCVTPDSRIFPSRPDWLLRQGDALHRGLLHPTWSENGDVYVLDTSQVEVRRHLQQTFASIAGMGFSYLKLDFLYTAAMQADAAEPRMTRAARLRRGLEAVREGAGDEAFLLGCGCPIGAAVGVVDGMRIGADVGPHWSAQESARIPGIEPTVPSVENALRNVLSRAWMHRRLWLNDPDCLMTRSDDTALTDHEVQTLASVLGASGGMLVFSDDVPKLGDAEAARLRGALELARDVDAGGTRGTARAIGLTRSSEARGLVSRTPSSAVAALVNWADVSAVVAEDLKAWVPSFGPLPPEPLLGSRDPEPRDDGWARAELAPHESLLLRVGREIRLGVFCDYDGTFAIQDVGATLAKRHAADRRPALWERLQAGEFTAWEYNMELLDGLPLAEATVDAFLQTIEPDPGARPLLSWCESHEIPFRVLSDGFDRNLDRLQELHSVRFAYDANRLWYENDHWRLAAGAPDPTCGCGTGVCKAGCIRAFRAAHPGATTVHIGNGRVSDLCGARAADVVFAKDTLAEELAAQGVAFERFETLHDVVRGLEVLRRKLEG